MLSCTVLEHTYYESTVFKLPCVVYNVLFTIKTEATQSERREPVQ